MTGRGSEWGRHVKDSQGTGGTTLDREENPNSGDQSVRVSFTLQEFTLGAFNTVSPQALKAGLSLPPGPVGHLGGSRPMPAATDMGGGNDRGKAYTTS